MNEIELTSVVAACLFSYTSQDAETAVEDAREIILEASRSFALKGSALYSRPK